MKLANTLSRRISIAVFAAVGAFLMSTDFAAAQSLGVGSSSDPTGERPESTKIGFFELLESGSDAMLSAFEPERQAPTVEEPEWDSLASPRQTILTFYEAMNHVAQGRRDALPTALKTFGSGERRGESPEQTAFDLLNVLDRLPELSPGALPGERMVRDANISRYELFPRGISNQWLYRALGESPDGAIVLVKEGDRWLFDEATIRGAGKLISSMTSIPPRERIDRKGELFYSVMEPLGTETSAMGYVKFLLWSLAGIFLAWLFGRGLNWIERRKIMPDDGIAMAVLESFRLPAMTLLTTLGFAIGTTQLTLHPSLSSLRWKLIEMALVIAGVMLLISLLELLVLGVRRVLKDKDDPYSDMMSIITRRLLRVVAGVTVALFVMQNVFKWDVTSLLGGFAIIALALSLAAQDAVKNLFGALTIFANRPFLRGDWITFDGRTGTVEDVSLQLTQLRLLSGEVWAVPNMNFIDKPVENLSLRKYLRRTMNIQVIYGTPAEKLDKAISILEEILCSNDVVGDGKGDMEEHPPKVFFDQFGSHFLNLRADYWYMMDPEGSQTQRDTERGWFSYLHHCTMVNREILKQFNDAEIEFAFPTQTLHIENESAIATT